MYTFGWRLLFLLWNWWIDDIRMWLIHKHTHAHIVELCAPVHEIPRIHLIIYFYDPLYKMEWMRRMPVSITDSDTNTCTVHYTLSILQIYHCIFMLHSTDALTNCAENEIRFHLPNGIGVVFEWQQYKNKRTTTKRTNRKWVHSVSLLEAFTVALFWTTIWCDKIRCSSISGRIFLVVALLWLIHMYLGPPSAVERRRRGFLQNVCNRKEHFCMPPRCSTVADAASAFSEEETRCLKVYSHVHTVHWNACWKWAYVWWWAPECNLPWPLRTETCWRWNDSKNMQTISMSWKQFL